MSFSFIKKETYFLASSFILDGQTSTDSERPWEMGHLRKVINLLSQFWSTEEYVVARPTQPWHNILLYSSKCYTSWASHHVIFDVEYQQIQKASWIQWMNLPTMIGLHVESSSWEWMSKCNGKIRSGLYEKTSTFYNILDSTVVDYGTNDITMPQHNILL